MTPSDHPDQGDVRSIQQKLAGSITTLENKLHHKEISYEEYDNMYKFYIVCSTRDIATAIKNSNRALIDNLITAAKISPLTVTDLELIKEKHFAALTTKEGS